ASLRLREAWTVLQQELSASNRIALRPRLERHIERLRAAAAKEGRAITISANIEDIYVRASAYTALEVAAVQVLSNAIITMERRDDRILVGKKPEGTIRLEIMIVGGAIVMTMDDDGPGVDPQKLAQATLADPTTSLGGRPIDLRSVRTFVTQEKGSIRVR